MDDVGVGGARDKSDVSAVDALKAGERVNLVAYLVKDQCGALLLLHPHTIHVAPLRTMVVSLVIPSLASPRFDCP